MKSVKTIFILLCSMLGQLIAYSQDLNSSIYFESGQAKLSKNALIELKTILETCQGYPDVAIDIKAYADDRGSEKMNQKLSKRRASAVVQFLKENGLNPHKQLVNGLGEVALSNTADVASERQKNRRVDIQITPFAPQNWSEYYSFYKNRNTQVYQIRNNRDTSIVGKKGTVLFIPKNSFQASGKDGLGNDLVEVKLYEAYSYKDMLFQNLTTVSDGKMLETGGMVHIEANRVSDGAAVTVRPDKQLRLTMPSANELPEGMQLFTAERSLDATGETVNWTTDGKSKFEQPDLIETINTSSDYFSKLIKEEHKAPVQMDMPNVNFELVANAPFAPTIRPIPARNFEMPQAVSDFETFQSEHPPKKATKNKRKESKGQYKKRMDKAYRLAKLYFRRDSSQYERALKKYNVAVALHVQDSLGFDEKMAFYKLKQAEHEQECNKIRVWLADNKNTVESWIKEISELNKLAIGGKTIRKYFFSINKMFSLRAQMMQEAQRAGLYDVMETLDQLSLNLSSVKRASIKLHLSVKDLKVKVPSLYQTGKHGKYFTYGFEFRNSRDLTGKQLIAVYKKFVELNEIVPTLEKLVANFEDFRHDPALETVVDYLDGLGVVNQKFMQENAKRRLQYFVTVWEAKWYDALTDRDKDVFDAGTVYEKEAFIHQYIAKQKEIVRLARLKSFEAEYKEFFTEADKVAYAEMTSVGKERFMNGFIRQSFGRIENVVGISKLGWINCDAFYGKELMLVKIPKPELKTMNVKYYMCLQGRRSVLPLSNNGKTLQGRIPPGSSVKIIGIALDGGKVALSETNGNIDDLNNKPLANFKEMRMSDIAAVIH